MRPPPPKAPGSPEGLPPFERIAFVCCRRAGALGTNQVGICQNLAEDDLHRDWTAGISIGAIKAALITG
ncbi:hypothetical protein [Phyllobacterium lublinensis]|uniref:hypothetical protein n=1 Tax=Phyllobacterium lublinensis TaxID=2875708 RepID=UPI001CCAD7F2|nr:hypothetical protein [Phyllobacterium sp. 2063]MBZ9653623.1 hypothetical protein [Phyllobacterium sp. 2063]